MKTREQIYMEMVRENGRKGGKIGGKRRAEKLSPERRREIARMGGIACAEARKAKGE